MVDGDHSAFSQGFALMDSVPFPAQANGKPSPYVWAAVPSELRVLVLDDCYSLIAVLELNGSDWTVHFPSEVDARCWAQHAGHIEVSDPLSLAQKVAFAVTHECPDEG